MTGYEFCVLFYHARREWRAMQRYARKMRAVVEAHDYPTYRWAAELYHAVASAALGDATADGDRLRQNIAALDARGIRMFLPQLLAMLAEVCIAAGQLDAAQTALDEALASAAQTGEHRWDAELHRLGGDLLAGHGDLQAAETAYRQALDLAQAQAAGAARRAEPGASVAGAGQSA
jgi:predicted negative regulator of RcsB-dependent stress response